MKLDMSEVAPTRQLKGGNCPFRGLPHYLLDDRCPLTVPVVTSDIEDLRTDSTSVKVPIVPTESGCARCLGERIREREAGEYAPSTTAEHTPTRRRRLSK
jgi:hypothetical protein